jgi:ATP-dependent helicase YprA (DUF1998 family)
VQPPIRHFVTLHVINASRCADRFRCLLLRLHLICSQMASASSSFAQQQARSYQNLDSARCNAAQKNGYSSSSTRAQLSELFRVRFGSNPHEWQLDVTEAILLSLDSIVIAGTGAGKTMPFMMPLLLNKKKKVVILSPLKVLQEDQVSPFFQSFSFYPLIPMAG